MKNLKTGDKVQPIYKDKWIGKVVNAENGNDKVIVRVMYDGFGNKMRNLVIRTVDVNWLELIK